MSHRTTVVAFLALLLSALVAGPAPAAAAAQDGPQGEPPTITVTGTGRVKVAPDQAVVRLGAVVQAEEAAAAQEQLNEIVRNAIEAIRELDVPEANIQTSELSLSPVYAQPDRRRPGEEVGAVIGRRPTEPRIVAYRATNVLSVTVTDLSKIGDVIDAGVAAGANEIQGISFGLRNDLPQRLAALKEAVNEAKQKAEAMASALGVALVEPIDVQEQGLVRPYMQMDYAYSRAEGLAAATPVQPGEVAVEATVLVRYRIDTGASAGHGD